MKEYKVKIDMNVNTNLNILIYKSDGFYIAENIKLDYCTQSKTMEKAIENLRMQCLYEPLIKEQIEKEEGVKCALTPKTPKYFKKYFDQGKIIKKYCKHGDIVMKIGKKETEKLHKEMFKNW
jgi:hypothetical protein